MKSKGTVILIVFVLMATLNGTVWLGSYCGYWPWAYSFYFYWAELALTGILALFLYARHLLVFFLILIALSSFLGLRHLTFMSDMKIPLSFWGIYSLFWLVYFEIRRMPISHGMRRHHPFQQFLFYAGYMAIAITASTILTSHIYFGKFYVPVMQSKLLTDYLLMTIGIPTLTIGVFKIIGMIGERHVFHFLLGTYHSPAERKRIVLFLDMAGSSGAAEKMGPAQSMDMIARFIFDACSVFRMNGGDIVNYTGDGLVVLWTIYEADKVIRAIDMLDRRIAKSAEEYRKNFDMVPGFRVGIHAGSVVISQIGEEKLFLGVYGDVMNTAARIEQMNKELGTRILMSKAFKHYLSLPAQKKIKPMGTIDLRGKEEAIEVFTLSGI